MKKSTALVVLGTLGGSAFLSGCRSNTADQESRYDNSTSGGRGGVGGFVGGRGYSSPRGGFGSTGSSSGRSGGFFSGG